MQLNPEEITALAQAEATPRMDIYAFIHKALRAFMSDTLIGLGRADVSDDADLNQACARVQQMLDFCRSHLRHENEFLHPAMERHAPGSATAVAHEHAGHEQAIAALAAGTAQLMACPRERRAQVAHALYKHLALFVAHNFEHMHQEETAHNAVLWAAYGDAELMAIEQAIVASIPPDAMAEALHWFIPALHAGERAAMLDGMRREMPPEPFANVLEIARATLDTDAHARLLRALGLPVAPGLMTA